MSSLAVIASHLVGAVVPLWIPLEVCRRRCRELKYADDVMGYVLWGVGIVFFLGLVIAIASLVAGRIVNMPHATKMGIVGIVMVIVAAIAYVVAPGIVDGILDAAASETAMLRNRSRTTRNAEAAPWSRTRLLALFGGLVVAVVLTLVGGGLAIWHATMGARPTVVATDETATAPTETRPNRDEVAAAAMPSVDPQAAFHPDPATAPGGSIVVPQPTVLDGPAGVPTGFPHTNEGAVGQWAAIVQTVLESMSLPRTRQAHAAWVQPGGPAFQQWTLTRNVTSFLTAARQGGDEKDLTTVVSATPAAGLVRGRRAGLGGGLCAAGRAGLD